MNVYHRHVYMYLLIISRDKQPTFDQKEQSCKIGNNSETKVTMHGIVKYTYNS